MTDALKDLIDFKAHDPRFKTLLLLPDWNEQIFQELMKGVDPNIYIEVYTLLRKMLFIKRNKLYNPLAKKD